jgi:hypothetical protein
VDDFVVGECTTTTCNKFHQPAEIGLGVRRSLVPPSLLAHVKIVSEKTTAGLAEAR